MAKYWSATTTSFWDSAVVATAQMPSDKVAITDAEYADLMSKQESGYRIVHNTSTGKPQAVAQSLTDATRTVQALDSEVVHKSGNEVITGTKRFESTVFAQHSIDNVKTVPSVNQYQTALILRDNQGQAFGHIQTASYADTESVLVKLSIVDGIRNGQTYDGALLTHAIGIGMDKDGNHFTHAPTPSAGDDSNQIATTKWVNDAIETKAEDSAVVHKADTETITGAKTFSAATTFGDTVNLNASVQGGAGRDIWIAHATGGTEHRTVLLAGNAYADGASLYLHAKDQANAGRFDMVAHDGTNSKILVGKPDGTLTWGGNKVDTFPTGTKMLFNQAAAPTGWTKQTSVNDAALRVVSGTTGGGTGGSLAFSTLFATGKDVSLSGNVGATTLTAAQMPKHSHTLNIYNSGSGSSKVTRACSSGGDLYGTPSTSTAGSSSSHTHTLAGTAKIALDVKYTDVIICAKD